MPTAEHIKQQVVFQNTGPDQVPGVIVMQLHSSWQPDHGTWDDQYKQVGGWGLVQGYLERGKGGTGLPGAGPCAGAVQSVHACAYATKKKKQPSENVCFADSAVADSGTELPHRQTHNALSQECGALVSLPGGSGVTAAMPAPTPRAPTLLPAGPTSMQCASACLCWDGHHN